MKKTIFVLFAAMMVSLSANAQFYAGGTACINFNVNGNSTDNSKTTNTTFNVNVIPEIGYWINDNMAVGAYFSIVPGINGYKNVTDIASETITTENNNKSFGWSVSPYFRYKFAEAGRFKFYADGNVSLGSTTITYFNSKGENIGEAQTQFNWGIGVAPSIAFSITDKWDAVVRFASIGFSMNGKNTHLGISALYSNSIGLYYNF